MTDWHKPRILSGVQGQEQPSSLTPHAISHPILKRRQNMNWKLSTSRKPTFTPILSPEPANWPPGPAPPVSAEARSGLRCARELDRLDVGPEGATEDRGRTMITRIADAIATEATEIFRQLQKQARLQQRRKPAASRAFCLLFRRSCWPSCPTRATSSSMPRRAAEPDQNPRPRPNP